ncbi:MAG: hypothetical protein AAFV98_00950 [Chloroflexota bacterium]
MNNGQRRGTFAIGIGFVLVAIGGVILSLFAGNVLTAGQVVLGGIIFFLIVSPLFGYGIYTYARFSEASALETNEEMEKPRQLLDLLREQGHSDIITLAETLDTQPEMIRGYIDDLVALNIFSGIADWENGMLAVIEPTVLDALASCRTCKTTISIKSGVTICPTCYTHYYRPEIEI